jgi:uncharacterized protein with HEPN domain
MPHRQRRDELYLADIVEAARTVTRWLRDSDREWGEDEILRNAVLRQLTIIGEAAACLSEETRHTLPDIPWQEIRGFRNQTVHAYFALDWAIIWEVADSDVPDLERRVLALLRAEYPEIARHFDD